MKCYRGEFLPYHPAFPEGSAATCHESANPVALETPDIEYTAEDDEAIKVFVRATGKNTLFIRSFAF